LHWLILSRKYISYITLYVFLLQPHSFYVRLIGNPRCHLVALESLYSRTCEGEPSLQNALTLAESRLNYVNTIGKLRISALKVSRTADSIYVPHHSEIVALMANLTTCDPGDIHQTIQSLVSNRIRCSVISLAVEVFVYRALAQLTKGVFHVILDETHLKAVLKDFVPPPVAAVESDATLIRMGFPHSETFDLDCFFTKRCICHLHSQPSNSNDMGPSINPRPQYACPRCRAAYCELPIECSVCGLTLAAAPHLARAYHHLFPLDTFDVITSDPQNKTIDTGEPPSCSGCDCPLSTHLPKYQCKKCEGLFCSACDAFLHDSVHSCPSCVSKLTLQF
ncbi:transcription initiation factor TFIIH subunit 2, partial [Paragonimus westermani]